MHVQPLLMEIQRIRLEVAALVPDGDTDIIDSTVEGLVDDVSLDDAILQLDRILRRAETHAAALKDEVTILSARRERLEARADAMKAMIERLLKAAGVKKRELATGTFSIAKRAPKLGPFDEAAVPPEFWIERDPVVDRKALLDALKAGATIPGITIIKDVDGLNIRR